MVGRNRPGESKKLLSSPCGSLSEIALREPVRRELSSFCVLCFCTAMGLLLTHGPRVLLGTVSPFT